MAEIIAIIAGLVVIIYYGTRAVREGHEINRLKDLKEVKDAEAKVRKARVFYHAMLEQWRRNRK